MLRRVALVRTDGLKELSTSIIRVTRIAVKKYSHVLFIPSSLSPVVFDEWFAQVLNVDSICFVCSYGIYEEEEA
jgi:hypothetical protein